MVLTPKRIAVLLGVAFLLILFFGWLMWNCFSHGVFSRARCPRCGSERIRGSLTRQPDDWWMKWILLTPFRCMGCGLRHYNVRWVSLARNRTNSVLSEVK